MEKSRALGPSSLHLGRVAGLYKVRHTRSESGTSVTPNVAPCGHQFASCPLPGDACVHIVHPVARDGPSRRKTYANDGQVRHHRRTSLSARPCVSQSICFTLLPGMDGHGEHRRSTLARCEFPRPARAPLSNDRGRRRRETCPPEFVMPKLLRQPRETIARQANMLSLNEGARPRIATHQNGGKHT